jgi:hypothetical protein
MSWQRKVFHHVFRAAGTRRNSPQRTHNPLKNPPPWADKSAR